ncbi:MAG TPA: hypothetical protein VFO38_05725 [Candidatus Saccharimonadales bacterium]|nr:hypothetical protein [Candidatus Saccharimonadales bacterium]
MYPIQHAIAYLVLLLMSAVLVIVLPKVIDLLPLTKESKNQAIGIAIGGVIIFAVISYILQPFAMLLG